SSSKSMDWSMRGQSLERGATLSNARRRLLSHSLLRAASAVVDCKTAPVFREAGNSARSNCANHRVTVLLHSKAVNSHQRDVHGLLFYVYVVSRRLSPDSVA